MDIVFYDNPPDPCIELQWVRWVSDLSIEQHQCFGSRFIFFKLISQNLRNLYFPFTNRVIRHIYNQLITKMCFVKNLVVKKIELESAFIPITPQKSQITQEQSASCEFPAEKNQPKLDLFSLFQTLLLTNSAALIHTQNELNDVIENIQKADTNIKIMEEPKIEESSHFPEQEEAEPIVQKIFGGKNYKYKLQIVQKIPQVLYKQRNFNFQIQLTDRKQQPIRNANMIPICIGALTKTGQWINQNRHGQGLIKGKSETQLCGGKAQFEKIYLRQVSRPYPQGKIHLVVYAKPSMMKYLSHADYEERVNESDIMPLIIKDVSVKSKKK